MAEGTPWIEVQPQSIQFQTVAPFVPDTRVVQVINQGTQLLEIKTIQLEGDEGFTLLQWVEKPFSDRLFPDRIGSTPKSLEIQFAPQKEKTFTANIVIVSNAENSPSLRVPVVGLCLAPDIQVSPTLLDFESTELNSSTSLNLQIKNVGQGALVIKSEQIRLGSEDPQAPFLWAASDLSLEINQSASIRIIYAPKEFQVDPNTHQIIPHEEFLRIFSNDPDENPLDVPLKGRVKINLPPLVGARVLKLTALDGSDLPDSCSIAPSDTLWLEGIVLDPEGDLIQSSDIIWKVEKRPDGSQRDLFVPNHDPLHPSFKPDLYGDYALCLYASDPQGGQSKANVDSPCTCTDANAAPVDHFECPCIRFTAYPREDIRVELIWDFIGPDLDLHLIAPGGQYCSMTRDCRSNPMEEDPTWDRFACVESDTVKLCLTPNCNPQDATCESYQECYDEDGSGPGSPGCYNRRCSGTDCYWDSRNPDWGNLGDEGDDPFLAIDCPHDCRAENINLNLPAPGIYSIAVNYYEYSGDTIATVRIFFKGDQQPIARFQSLMTKACDTWNVALVEWTDPTNHPVVYLDDAHSELCCQ